MRSPLSFFLRIVFREFSREVRISVKFSANFIKIDWGLCSVGSVLEALSMSTQVSDISERVSNLLKVPILEALLEI